jgi:hypothetical protein
MARMDIDTEGAGGPNLAERIRRLANGRNTLDVAQFQFVGIAEIRRRYGPRWAEKRDRVSQVASHFISRRIAPDDVLVAGADGYLLVFGSLTGGPADQAARRISAELNAYFLGEPDLDDIQIGSQHHSMSIDDFAEAFGAMLAAAGRTSTPSEAPDPFSMGFTPLWNARSGALSAFFVTPVERATGAPLDWDMSTHRHAEMDERKLKASEIAMRSLWTSGGRSVVGVAVHVSTLNSQQRMARVVQTMASFDRRTARYRLLRVSCIEPGYPRIYLEDIMRTMRPHAPNIALGLDWQAQDLPSVLKLQPTAIGFSIPVRTHDQPGLRAEVHGRIAAAVEQARNHGVLVGVEGDLGPEQAVQFMQMGVSFICSPRIWPVRSQLTSAELWPASRLIEMAQKTAAA